jgi:hypothetical protein
MISVTSTFLETLPGEDFFLKHLQTPIIFILGAKILKQGKLILYKRTHYYFQITILNLKQTKESFEIPIPFKVEEYTNEGLIYFDYRLKSLIGYNEQSLYNIKKTKIKNTNPSQYYDKILEIQTKNV